MKILSKKHEQIGDLAAKYLHETDKVVLQNVIDTEILVDEVKIGFKLWLKYSQDIEL